jgi:hypothetical protein
MNSDEFGAMETALRQRFSMLKATRGNSPVYALEHGLSEAELQRLSLAIGPMLRFNGVTQSWSGISLPLIVLATETGYHYRGTGTDFWPILSGKLGASFTDRDRQNLSALFETANRTLAIKKPAPTAWNRAFRHIAWPIANAVAPLEVHRALASALHRMFIRPPDAFEGAELAIALRRAALADGAPERLLQWLQDDQLATAMSRRLLELPEDNFLAPEVVSRIWSDMSSDVFTRRALSNALAEHRQLQSGGRAFGRYGRAYFALGLSEGEIALHIVPPVLGQSDHQRLVRQVQGRRISLWNLSGSVALLNLCEGRSTQIELERMPELGETFLSDDALVGLEATAVTALRGLAPDLSSPLLFPAGGGLSAQADYVNTNASRYWWLLSRRRPPSTKGLRVLGSVAGADLIEIDLNEPDAQSWLEAQRIIVEKAPVLEPILTPILKRQPRGYDFPPGLPALFRVSGSADGTKAILGSAEVNLAEDRSFVAVDDDPPGDHLLRLQSSSSQTVGGWRRISSVSAQPAPISVLHDAGELTLEALLDGQVSIRITAEPDMLTPTLILSVVTGGAEIARARAETDGPALFGGGSPLLRDLTEQLKASEAFERGELVAELDGLSRDTWAIGRRLRTARWERHNDAWSPIVEGQVVGSICTLAETPYQTGVGLLSTTAPALLLPILEDGRILEADGLVAGPRSLTFGFSVPVEDLGALTRTWGGADDVGLKTTSTALVRWQCASSAHVVLDLVRSRAIQSLERMTVCQLCGPDWLALEDDLISSASDFWGIFADLTISRGMSAGEGFPTLPEANRDSLRDCLAARFKDVAPRLRALSTSEVEALAPKLDDGVNEAWEDHFQALERAGAAFHLEEEPDAGNDGSVWASAVRHAEGRYQLAPLGRKLAPSRRGSALMAFNYEAEGLPALGALLEAEHVDLRARPPHWLAAGDISRGLMFWTDARAFGQEPEGQEALQRLLADRHTARAIRYAALRYSLSRGRPGASR